MPKDATGRIRTAARIDPHTLDLLFEANEQGLDHMARLAALSTAHAVPPLIADLHGVWRNVDADTLRHAARCPTLLLDIRGWSNGESQPAFFPRPAAVALLRCTLTLAWYVCRTTPHAAGVLLGLRPRCCQAIARLRLGELDRIARSRSHCLRPRWEDDPQKWTTLLMAARNDCPQALEDFKLRALQELIGELLPHHSPA